MLSELLNEKNYNLIFIFILLFYLIYHLLKNSSKNKNTISKQLCGFYFKEIKDLDLYLKFNYKIDFDPNEINEFIMQYKLKDKEKNIELTKLICVILSRFFIFGNYDNAKKLFLIIINNNNSMNIIDIIDSYFEYLFCYKIYFQIQEDELIQECYYYNRNLLCYNKQFMINPEDDFNKVSVLTEIIQILSEIKSKNIELGFNFYIKLKKIIFFSLNISYLAFNYNNKKINNFEEFIEETKNSSRISFYIFSLKNFIDKKILNKIHNEIDFLVKSEINFYYYENYENILNKNLSIDCELFYYLFLRSIYFSIGNYFSFTFEQLISKNYIKNKLTKRLEEILRFVDQISIENTHIFYQSIIGKIYFLSIYFGIDHLIEKLENKFGNSYSLISEKINYYVLRRDFKKAKLFYKSSESISHILIDNSYLVCLNEENKYDNFLNSFGNIDSKKFIYYGNKNNKSSLSFFYFYSIEKYKKLANKIPLYFKINYLKGLFHHNNLDEIFKFIDTLKTPSSDNFLPKNILLQILLNNFSNSGDCISSMNIIKEINNYNISFFYSSYGFYIKLLCSLNAEDKVYKKIDEMIEREVKPSIEYFCGLIELFIKKKKPDNIIGIIYDIKQNEFIINDYSDVYIIDNAIFFFIHLGDYYKSFKIIELLLNKSPYLELGLYINNLSKRMLIEIENHNFHQKIVNETKTFLKEYIKLLKYKNFQIINEIQDKINREIINNTEFDINSFNDEFKNKKYNKIEDLNNKTTTNKDKNLRITKSYSSTKIFHINEDKYFESKYES